MTTIPTVQQNIDTALAFLEAEMGQEAAINSKSFLLVLSRLQGMMKSSLYLFSVEQMKKVLALTAVDEDLDAIGIQYNVTRKQDRSAVLTFRVLGDEDAVIPLTTTWNAESNGMRYFQNLEYTIPVGGTYVDVQTEAQFVGNNGNLRDGTVVDIGATTDGIVNEATVVGTVELGADVETNDDYRIRVLDELRTVGGGSNAADIRTWGQAPPNIKRAYPYTGDMRTLPVIVNPGERTVFIEATSSYNVDGIADAPLLAKARTSITTDPETGLSRQCLGSVDSLLYVESITREGFTVKLTNLVVEEAKRDACEADLQTAVDEYLRDFSTHIDGLDPPGFRNNIITAVKVSDVVQDVVDSYFGSVNRVDVYKDTLPLGVIGSYTLNPGELAKGTVSYA